jgi:L-fuconolactonase
MRIDAHHHVWRLARGDYDWLTPDLPIHRDYGLDDLRPLLGDIGGTILVQAAPTEAETRYLLDVARCSDGLVRGVVGWTDFAAPDAADRIGALARDPLLKGLRPMLQDMADTAWILRPAVAPALRALARHDLRLDLLIRPRHLTAITTLAEAAPDMAVVIDHAAKPDIRAGLFQPWAGQMRHIARITNWHCKLSGLVTEANPAGWRVEDLHPYVEHLLACFGPERLIWGSDWPVVNLAGGYAGWRAATDTLLAHLAPAERAMILGGNAARFYAV